MASQLNFSKTAERLIIVFVLAIFAITATKYYFFTYENALSAYYNFIHMRYIQKCPEGTIKKYVPDGAFCASDKLVKYNDIYEKIFYTYPISLYGKETIFPFQEEGSISDANNLLKNIYTFDRFDSVTIKDNTWEENFYDEQFWRFQYYGFRHFPDLIYAAKRTDKPEYYQKMKDDIASFFSHKDSKIAWQDLHAVPYRAITLINAWWNLREAGALDIDTSSKILSLLEEHANYLLLRKNFQSSSNHSIAHSTALFLTGYLFPDLSDASHIRSVGEERLTLSINTIVDHDGVLVENSPYYHLYTLDKYWHLKKYFDRYLHNTNLRRLINTKVDLMVNYATHITIPNLEIPLLGASLYSQVGYFDQYREIAKKYPHLEFVLTQGKSGKKPKTSNVHFSSSGQTVMRSGWGNRHNFTKQSHAIFDAGPYRTNHSDLDALSFTWYANQRPLIIDTGLYSYENNRYKDYFHGTKGHNTVMVNGKNQRASTSNSRPLVSGKDWSYQTGYHHLYSNTEHRRSLAMLGQEMLLVVDNLLSEDQNSYEQLFHLPPDLSVKKSSNKNLTTIVDETDNPIYHILQINKPENINLTYELANYENPNGFCSYEYEKLIPCYALSYEKNTDDALYITLLITDKAYRDLEYNLVENEYLNIKVKKDDYRIVLNESSHYEIVDGNINVQENTNETKVVISSDNPDFLKPFPDGFYLADKKLYSSIDEPFSLYIDGVGEFFSNGQQPLDLSFLEEANYSIPIQEDAVPIIGYHNIYSHPTQVEKINTDIDKNTFTQQIDAFSQANCRWLTVSDFVDNYLLANRKKPANACLMTFDDGRKNNYTIAHPLLKENGIVATFYILPGRISSGSYLSWSDVNKLYEYGHEIGSHSVDSGGFITTQKTLPEIVLQVDDSKSLLETRGYEITSFAYPFGEQNQQIETIVKQAGYVSGRSSQKKNPWRDPRVYLGKPTKDTPYNLNYIKAETRSVKDLADIVTYDYWWQVEEEYQVVYDLDKDITPISSQDPTSESFAVVKLPDVGDTIRTYFQLNEPGDYLVTILARRDNDRTSSVDLSINGREIPLRLKNPFGSCVDHKAKRYCYYEGNINLNSGLNSIEFISDSKTALVDKFRLELLKQKQDSYEATLTKLPLKPKKQNLKTPPPLILIGQ